MFEFSIECLNDSNQWMPLKNWTRPIIDKVTLDETHDETQIFLSCSELDQPFKPFTKFIINIVEKDENGEIVDNDTLYRVVVSDEIEQVRFGSKKLYNHEIRLAEASKELERYIVDNLSFTNAWNKAFQVNDGTGYITDVNLHDDWYIRDVQATSGDVTYYVNMFTNYNSFDALRVNIPPYSEQTIPIDNTFIGRTLNQYNTYNDFSFSSSMPTSVLRDNPITIPGVDVSKIATKTIMWLPVGLDKYDAYYEFRNKIDHIKLIDPYGEETEVEPGETIQLSILGRYKVEYQITRQVRTHMTYKDRIFETLIQEWYYGWYNGITTTITFEVFCVDSGVQTNKLSVYDILSKLVQCTPTRFNGDNNIKFSLYEDGTEKSIFNRYAGKEAPEMILTNKNLWEALREIGGTINAIPYLHIQDRYNWNVIDFMQLGSEEKESDDVEQNYCNSQSYYDSENFTASYDMSIDNMINPVSTKEGFLSESGYQISKSIRSEEVEISETSMCIQTNYPIYKVDSLVYVNYNLPVPKTELINNVLEKSLYDTLVSNTANAGKAVNLYFTQGKPNVYGLQYKISSNSYTSAITNRVAIREIIKTLTGVELTTDELLQGKFIIKYVPYLNARIRIYKPNAPKLNINTAMFQNQSANVIDARALGRKMVANIGRVGNLGYVDSLKVYHLKNIPLKGQRSKDGYFVGTITTEYDRHHLLSAVQYTKDYQKISDYINISNLQRYYEVSEKQSIGRYLNSHMFYIFGDSVAEINKDKGLNQAENYPAVNYLASLFVDQGYNRKINASILSAYSEENNQEFVCSRLYLNSNAIAIGNSINIITDFVDNYGAGNQAVPYTKTEQGVETQAYMNRAVPYSDKLGKIKHIDIQNVTDSNIDYSEATTPATLENNINKLAKSLPAITDLDADLNPTGEDYITIADNYLDNNKPTFSNIGCRQDINVYKDSREVIHINQQHHFLVNDSSIVIGNAMTEQCRFIQENTMTCRLVFLKDKIDAYEFTIKDSDIIDIITPEDADLQPIAAKVKDLCDGIDTDNLLNIISTTGNTAQLYILPNIEHGGWIVGLEEDAEAWAIITDENELIIGKNEHISIENDYEDAVITQINMSVTSEF